MITRALDLTIILLYQNRKMKVSRKVKTVTLIILSVIAIGFSFNENTVIPVQGATNKDWNHSTFWYEPWGKSGVHKGIDVFFKAGTPVISSTPGIVIYTGNVNLGGKVVAVLGPKWRIHYYAHLDNTNVSIGAFVDASEIIGEVGNTGNAKGKPSHLHYSIITLLPYIWRWDMSSQGWKKMFFLNPSEKLLSIKKN